MDIKKTALFYPHFCTRMAQLTQLRLFFAITLITMLINPMHAQAAENMSIYDEYTTLQALPAPTDPTYEQIARRLYKHLGLHASHDKLFVVASDSAQFMTTKHFQYGSSWHHFICINQAGCATLTPAEREFLIAHETMHTYLGHHTTRDDGSPECMHKQEYEADIAAALTLGTPAGGISLWEKLIGTYDADETTHPSFIKRREYLQELTLPSDKRAHIQPILNLLATHGIYKADVLP